MVEEPEELDEPELEDVVDDLLASVHGVPKKRVIVPVYDTEDIT